MKKLMKLMLMAGVVAVVSLCGNKAMAQGGGGGGGGGGGFQGRMQQRLDALRTEMDVKDDAEWSAISNGIVKVFQARFANMNGGRGFNGNRGNNNNNGGDNGGQQPQRQRRGFGAPQGAEADALQAALDSKASPDEIKTKLAALRAAVKAQKDKAAADMAKAQDDLKQLLTARQEAVAVLNGLLD
jgi:hypothetical protein